MSNSLLRTVSDKLIDFSILISWKFYKHKELTSLMRYRLAISYNDRIQSGETKKSVCESMGLGFNGLMHVLGAKPPRHNMGVHHPRFILSVIRKYRAKGIAGDELAKVFFKAFPDVERASLDNIKSKLQEDGDIRLDEVSSGYVYIASHFDADHLIADSILLLLQKYPEGKIESYIEENLGGASLRETLEKLILDGLVERDEDRYRVRDPSLEITSKHDSPELSMLLGILQMMENLMFHKGSANNLGARWAMHLPADLELRRTKLRELLKILSDWTSSTEEEVRESGCDIQKVDLFIGSMEN